MSFGIDHPLIAVHDLANSASQAIRLGFRVNQRHQHPWGTDNHLLFFPHNFIELIEVGRPERLDYRDDNGFQFGQHIAQRLNVGEGIAMVALDSEDMARDHQALFERGATPPPPIIFQRIAHLPDGREEEVGVSLNIMHFPHAPFLSQFLCQQLRPDLFRVDASLEAHPNTVQGITALWYISTRPKRDIEGLRAIHGEQNVHACDGGYRFETDKGTGYVLTPEAIEAHFPLLHGIEAEPPRGIALTLECASLSSAQTHWDRQGIEWVAHSPNDSDIPPEVLGGTLLRFTECTSA